MSATAFYRREGDLVAPLFPVTGPWDPRNQNGVALSGLMAHALEQYACAEGLDLARYQIDILRPTPMAPSRVSVTPVREGSRMQMLAAELSVDGEVTVRASAVRIRRQDTPPAGVGPPPPPPEAADGRRFSNSAPLRDIVESRRTHGQPGVIGPGGSWFRMTGEIVEGCSITPFVQAAMVADFGSGLARVVDYRQHTFANIDICVFLARAPRGDWVHVDAAAVSHGQGRALVNTILSDRDGEFARAHQTLFVDPVRRPSDA